MPGKEERRCRAAGGVLGDGSFSLDEKGKEERIIFRTRGSRGEMPGEEKEGATGGVLGGGSFPLDDKGYLVPGVW